MYSSHKNAPAPALTAGFCYLPARFGAAEQALLLAEIRAVIRQAPLFVPSMPRSGRPLSVRMSNCGSLGWVSDRAGYRYQTCHPDTGRPWPAIPTRLLTLWDELAPGVPSPEACLINFYGPDARMGTHKDADEEHKTAPVVSVSLGSNAVFHIGGLARADRKHRLILRSGDVVVLGGEARFAYHGVDRIEPGTSALLPEGGRLNLTLRRVHTA